MNRFELKPGCVQSCPACPHRHLSTEESLARKQDWLQKRLGDFSEYLQEIRSVTDENRWHYRHKVCLSAEHEMNTWKIGVMKHERVIPIETCPVQAEQVNRSIRIISNILPPPEKFPLAYFMQSGAQKTLVCKCRELPDLSWLGEELKTELAMAGTEGLWLHLNPATGKKIIGKGGWYLIFGKPRSYSTDGFIYGPLSFQQVLPELYNNSLTTASEFLNPSAETATIDLYCGTGKTLKTWTEAGSSAIGVELGGEAIECAVENAPGAILLRGTCAQRIPQLDGFVESARENGKEILLYANPPRTGLEIKISKWIAEKLRPVRFAYLSCSAGTLYRDLTILTEHGFSVKSIIPYDFFPQTLHVETLALLTFKP